MKTYRMIIRTVLVVSLAVLPLSAWVVAPSALAAGKAPTSSAPSAQSEGRSLVASGAVEDSQQACLTRIPKDATAGQRLVAVESCKRDQTSRQSIQDVPGR